MVNIDFSRINGQIKPLHGVNNSPVALNGSIPEFADAGIPYVRLHDAAGRYGGTYFVDVPNIFRDFDADETDEASYDFAFTDAYLKSLVASGCKIFYRLGVTIENYWQIGAYRIHPPKDNLKWAKICEHIIMHYNEGWKNGFHFGIEYWEIWNEPENPPMWTGTRQQYFELYKTASNHLKNRFPDIKVGGYASCGFYCVTGDADDSFFRSFITYYEEFLKFVTSKDNNSPLDFFSFHLYTTEPEKIVLHAEYAKKKLIEAGLTGTELIFDEWNRHAAEEKVYTHMKTEMGASFTAAAFCLMQNSPIDKAMYYDALPTRSYCGLYTFPDSEVTRTYYAFKAYNELYKLKNSAEISCDIPALAAVNGKSRAVLLANYSSEEKKEQLSIIGSDSSVFKLTLTDKNNVFSPVGELDISQESEITLPPYSFLLLTQQ